MKRIINFTNLRYFSKERAGKSIRPGATIVLNGVPHRVTKMIQGKRGKGSGFVRATLRNMLHPHTFEKTFTSDDIVEHADLETSSCQYSWKDGDNYVFMDNETFEEVRLNESEVDRRDFLYVGLSVKLLWFSGKVIGVELPIICEYKVVTIDSANSTPENSIAILDTGLRMNVPAFVKAGDNIRINTVDSVYVDRIFFSLPYSAQLSPNLKSLNGFMMKIVFLIIMLTKFASFRLPVKRNLIRHYSLSKIDIDQWGYTRGNLHKQMEEALISAFGDDQIETNENLVLPTQPMYGDYQSNIALTLTKKLSMKPKDIAEKIVKQLKVDDIASINITGPGFITMKLTNRYVQSQLTHKLNNPKRLGISIVEKPQRIVVDFSSPNIAKEMHVGHLRSTILGDSLSRILEFLGHNVLRLNHVGDWGTQFGMLIHYLKTLHPESILITSNDKVDLRLSVADLMEFYRAAKKRFDEDNNFKDTARLEVVKLQAGNPDSLRVWKAICDKSREEFDKIYAMLNITLHERGESFYNPYLAPLVDKLMAKGIAIESQGSKCIFVPGNKYKTPEGEPLPLIIQKSDGGYLYATTDLAALIHRIREDRADRILYVTDIGQAQHFAMVFEVARSYNLIPETTKLHHVPFGLVLGEDGKKIKTRSGESVRLKELLDEAIANAERDISRRLNASFDTKETDSNDNFILSNEYKDIAATVGLAAVKYADLSLNRLSDYRFSFDRMLSLTGNTAPYMLYAYVRIRGIQRKAEVAANESISQEKFDSKVMIATDFLLNTSEEISLAKQILKLEEVLLEISQDYYPNKLCDYLFELSQRFNSFYEKCPVLKAESVEIQRSRTALCSLTADTLKLSLELLGISTVEKL